MKTKALALMVLAAMWAGVSVAQQADAFLGFGTTVGARGSATSSSGSTQGLNGGLYPVIGGDALFFHGLGFGGEVAWRGSRRDYQGAVPFRPIFWDLNAVYAPRLGRLVAPELQVGLGQESLRFYTGQVTCNPFTGRCQNFVSTNHLSGHFGAGLRIYKGNFFIRPEAHIYLVNDNAEFNTGKVGRVGVSLGYTFGR